VCRISRPARNCANASISRRAKEPLNRSRTVATEAFRDGMREARRSQWQAPLASLATKQIARKAPSLRVSAKCGACFVALLGIVAQATTFVARLASIRILPATQSARDLFRGSLRPTQRGGIIRYDNAALAFGRVRTDRGAVPLAGPSSGGRF
jgi:hypothetical protein